MQPPNEGEMSIPRLPQPIKQDFDSRDGNFIKVQESYEKEQQSDVQQAYSVGNCCERLHKYMWLDRFRNGKVYKMATAVKARSVKKCNFCSN
jgi:hypothetical protein